MHNTHNSHTKHIPTPTHIHTQHTCIHNTHTYTTHDIQNTHTPTHTHTHTHTHPHTHTPHTHTHTHTSRFFVVEDTILHTSQSLVSHKGGEDEGLMTRKIVHEFWQMALAEVLAVLRNNCVSGCKEWKGGKGMGRGGGKKLRMKKSRRQ